MFHKIEKNPPKCDLVSFIKLFMLSILNIYNTTPLTYILIWVYIFIRVLYKRNIGVNRMQVRYLIRMEWNIIKSDHGLLQLNHIKPKYAKLAS